MLAFLHRDTRYIFLLGCQHLGIALFLDLYTFISSTNHQVTTVFTQVVALNQTFFFKSNELFTHRLRRHFLLASDLRRGARLKTFERTQHSVLTWGQSVSTQLRFEDT